MRLARVERVLIALALIASACPRLCRAQLPMAMGAVTINMPVQMLGTLRENPLQVDHLDMLVGLMDRGTGRHLPYCPLAGSTYLE